MKRLAITILFVLTLAVCARAQVNSQRVIFTSSNPPTSCVAGKIVTNPALSPAKAWVGTSTGACTEIDASAAAPANATYITQTPNASLSTEQALSLLATGIPLITTTTGVISISSVTNDVQTKAAIVPNTAPTSGQILVGNAGGTAYAPVSMSSDATLASTGAITIANNAISLGKMATQATNTVLGNATSGTAVPTALPVGTCSTAGSALIWTTNTGFGCNTSITAAAAPVSGLTGAGTGVVAALGINIGTAGSPVLNGGVLGTPSSGTVTNLTGTASININGTVGATTPTTGGFTTATTSGSSTTLAESLVVTNTSNASTTGKSSVIDFQTKDTGVTLKTVAQIIASPDTNVNSNDGTIKIATRTGDVDPVVRMTIGNAGAITFTSGVTNASGTPGSLCYSTSTFEMTKNNALTCTVSHPKHKTGITPFLGDALSVLMRMQPKQFAYKDHPDRFRWGFLSTQLQGVDSKLGDGYDTKGEAQSIDIPGILAVNTKALQELNVKYEFSRNEFDAYKKTTNAKIAAQQRTIRRLKHRR